MARGEEGVNDNSEAQRKAVHNERIKLTAAYLNTAATSGAMAPAVKRPPAAVLR